MRKLILAICLFSSQVQAEQVGPSKEFITSVTYGVLAGTLVGVASLAFTTNPGENLNKIARGASLGLYLGIALGLFVVYGDSEEGSTEAVGLFPVLGDHGLEGAGAQLVIGSF